MFCLKRNLSIWQCIFRLCISICIMIATYFWVPPIILKVIIFVFAIIFATTAIIGYCPMDAMIRRSRKGK